MTEPKPDHDQQPEFITLEGLSLASTGRRRQFSARFVRAGKVRAAGNRPSNIEMTEGALVSAINKGLFDGKAVFIDHAGFFEHPSMRNLAGVTSDSEYDPVKKAITGVITFYSQAEGIADLLDEILADGTKKPDVGLSIVFWPIWQQEHGKPLRKIVDIRHVESVDLVFEPAADGRILEALSAAAQTPLSGGTTMPEERTNVPESPAAPQPVPAGDPNALVGEWLTTMATASAGVMIANSGLPAAARERLTARTYQFPGDVQQAIEAERSYLAALQESQVIQGMGGPPPRSPQISGGMTGFEEISLAFQALLDGKNPPSGVRPLSGIRELYLHLSGDYEMNGLFHSDRISFANVTSSTMANMTADALNKFVANEFQVYPRWWEKIIIQEDFQTLQTVKWVTLGGVGELPTVAEGAAYTELTWDDMKETGTFVKKGGYLGLTLEAIDKDDTRRLRAAPRALAQAAWLTLSKAISAVFTDNSGAGPVMSDSDNLFHANHANLGTTALSPTEYAVVRTAMRKQTELNSSERLGALTAPKYILVPPDLEITALKVLASQFEYTYALSNAPAAPDNVLGEGEGQVERLSFARDRVIVIDLWTDTNNWAAVCDPIFWPTIGVGFRYGRTPEVFSVASTTAGLMFTNDTLPVKVRYFFAVAPIDYRGMYKENVA
jgi:hypothetical protein